MAGRRPSVGIKLDVLGKPEVLAALRDVGAEGGRLADRIERVGPQAGAGLRAIDVAAGSARDRLDSLAGEAGAAGRVLTQFGTAGKIAAVGVGALTIGLAAAITRGREASRDFAEIGQQADRLGLTAERLQELQAAAASVGVSDRETMADLLGEIADRAAQAAQGSGEAEGAFKALGVAVLDAQGRLKPVDQLLYEVADGFAGLESGVEKVSLASSLFGDEGRKLIPLFEQGGAAVREYGDEAQRAGAIVGEDLVRESQRLNVELETQWRVLSTKLNVELVKLAPLFLDILNALSPVVQAVMDLTDAWRDLDRQQTRTVTAAYEDVVGQMVATQAAIDKLNRAGAGGGAIGQGANLRALEARMAELRAQKAELEAELERRRETGGTTSRTYTPPKPGESRSPPGMLNLPEDGKAKPIDERGITRMAPPLPRGMTRDQYDAAIKANQEATREAERLGESLSDLADKGLGDTAQALGEFAFGLRDGSDLLMSFLSDIGRDLPALLFGGANATTGIGGVLQSALGGATKGVVSDLGLGTFIKGLLGFAGGGSFEVSPASSFGIRPQAGDDRLVAFRARMGETVHVTRPDQAGGQGVVEVRVVPGAMFGAEVAAIAGPVSARLDYAAADVQRRGEAQRIRHIDRRGTTT